MPRLYLTPAELQAMPVGIGMKTQIAQLGTGQLDTLLMRASQEVDQCCQKRLQALGTTSLTSSVSAGATTLPVASTLTFDNGAEQAVYVGSGATQEIVEIVPGGVTLTGSTISPYPGTFTLAAPLVYAHNSGEPVTGVYREVQEAGGTSSSDPYTEAMLTQTAQLALAHLPPAHMELTRVVFVRNYPIITVQQVEHAYSFDTTYNIIDISQGISIERMQGWMRFKIGTVLMREGMMRVTYNGGYQVVPDDVKDATALFFTAQMMQIMNPFWVKSQTMGKRSLTFDWRDLREQARAILKPYYRTV